MPPAQVMDPITRQELHLEVEALDWCHMDHREVDAPWIGADRVEVSGMVGNGKGPDRERRCFCWEVLRALEFPRKGWAKYGWNQQTTPKTQRQMRLANTAQVGQSASVNAGTKPKH